MASKKKVSPAVLKYVTTVCRDELGEGLPDVELTESNGVTISSYAGAAFAAYWLTESEIVFRFRRPIDDTERASCAEFYSELTSPKDWLEYRRPLSRDPKPDLESKLAQVMGKAFFAISQGELKLEPITEADIKAGV